MKAENTAAFGAALCPHFHGFGAFSLWIENSTGLFNLGIDNVADGCSLRTPSTIIPLSV